LKVLAVAPDSPAAQAGIEVGDVLIKANRTPIASPEQLAAAVRDSDGNVTVTVRDVRTGRDVAVEVQAGVAPRTRPANISLGVKVELAFYQGEPAVKVVEVEPNSPAQRARIAPGMLIVIVNGTRVTNPDKLAEAERTAAGALKLQVVNPGDRSEQTVDVKLTN
jgi:S1-C subfamily serine protease